jgi:hypothetical protein
VRFRSVVSAALAIGVARDALAQTRQGSVDVTIDVASADSVHVEQRYLLVGRPTPIEFRILTRPCVTIENVRIERVDAALSLTETRTGPWISFRDTTSSTGDTLRLVARYDARLAGTGAIPLLHLTTALKGDSARVGPVSVTVRFADATARVDFPHMTRAVPTNAEQTPERGGSASRRDGTRQAPDEWSARYVAVPSLVEVSRPGQADCTEAEAASGDNGGLVWRFLLLVGIMAAWVPLYLVWARRSGDSA